MKRRNSIQNEKGMALLEIIPLLIIFIYLLGYGIGLFGAVHSSILHSISSRAYAFETFRNRTHTYYFRDSGSGESDTRDFLSKDNYRFHFTQSKQAPQNGGDDWIAQPMPISFLDRKPNQKKGNDKNTHQTEIFSVENRYRGDGINPIWIQIGYGLCLNAQCSP